MKVAGQKQHWTPEGYFRLEVQQTQSLIPNSQFTEFIDPGQGKLWLSGSRTTALN